MEIYPGSAVDPIVVPGRQLGWRSAILSILAIIIFLPATLFAYDFEGTVKVAGPVPIAPLIPVDEKHVAACGKAQESPSLIVGGGGVLQNAVVSLEPLDTLDPSDAPGASDKVTLVLDQTNCRFSPHVLIVPVGEAFLVTNHDPMDHDVRTFSGAEIISRFETPPFSKPVEQKLDKAGTYVVRCGLHKWMHAFVIASEHPFYAVTGPGGTFKINNLPPGKYRLHIWHERLGEHEEPVEISGVVNDFSFSFPEENGA